MRVQTHGTYCRITANGNMAGNYPIYDPGCVVDNTLKVEKIIDPCSNVELQWEGYPEHCDTIPQGYHVYRTTTPPTSSSVVLCVKVDDKKVLQDTSIYQNPLYYYETGGPVGATYTSLTPYGKQGDRNAITLNRHNNEYLEVPFGAQFDLKYEDFTIEMWVGNRQEQWKYYFPCQTLIAAYTGGTVNPRNTSMFPAALWRIFFEPTDATRSVTHGMSGAPHGVNGYSTNDSYTGNLVIEFNEYGDSSGQMISEVIMPLTSNADSSYSWAGNALRDGYSHVAVVRQGTALRVYVDGTLRSTIPFLFELGGSSTSINYPWQSITIGRHFGESGRLDPWQFSGSYGKNVVEPFSYTSDGDQSHLHGYVYDVRIVRGIGLAPPVGGQVDNVCGENAWHQSFDKVASLPHTTKRWTDTDTPVDVGTYYRVTAVQCGKDVSCICPNYVVSLKEGIREIDAISVNTPAELNTALDSEPPTMLDVFNTWDRSNPTNSTFYPGGAGAGGDHAAWYFNTSVNSFVNPNNTSQWVHITAPESQWMKKYKHEAIVQSGEPDDDMLGLTAAYVNINGNYYAINFMRTQGGWNSYAQYSGNWHCAIVGPGLHKVIGNKTIGPVKPNNGSWSNPGTGWRNRTALIKIERDGNIIRAWTGSHMGGSNVARSDHVIDPASEFVINLAIDQPPPGLASWLPFQGLTGYGFNAYSQGDAFYRDWYLFPNPSERIFDFSSGAPGVVYDWDRVRNKWIPATGTGWEVVGQVATTIFYPDTGKRYTFDCAGKLTVT